MALLAQLGGPGSWPDVGRPVADVCNGIGGKAASVECTSIHQPPPNPCSAAQPAAAPATAELPILPLASLLHMVLHQHQLLHPDKRYATEDLSVEGQVLINMNMLLFQFQQQKIM